jgi:hypothetical protein
VRSTAIVIGRVCASQNKRERLANGTPPSHDCNLYDRAIPD